MESSEGASGEPAGTSLAERVPRSFAFASALAFAPLARFGTPPMRFFTEGRFFAGAGSFAPSEDRSKAAEEPLSPAARPSCSKATEEVRGEAAGGTAPALAGAAICSAGSLARAGTEEPATSREEAASRPEAATRRFPFTLLRFAGFAGSPARFVGFFVSATTIGLRFPRYAFSMTVTPPM